MKNPFHIQNKLDEMQTQKMLTINNRGFWGTWTALLIAIAVQAAADVPPEQYMAEWIIFMLMCAYSLIEYLGKDQCHVVRVGRSSRDCILPGAQQPPGLVAMELLAWIGSRRGVHLCPDIRRSASQFLVVLQTPRCSGT